MPDCALVTFTSRGRLTASVLLATGQVAAAESQLLQMFVDSLRRVDVAKSAAASAEPFGKVLTLRERPIMIVVPWPDDAVPDEDHEVVSELAVHLAGAFFGLNQQAVLKRR